MYRRWQGYILFTSNASKRNMETGGIVVEDSGSSGRFAAHPTNLRTRPLNKFLRMIQETGWTASIMIGTVQRQHPLVDIDLHSADARQHRRLLTLDNISIVADRAQRRIFQCDHQTAAPMVLQPPNKSGFHVVALGCVITGKHARMNKMFARVMQ